MTRDSGKLRDRDDRTGGGRDSARPASGFGLSGEEDKMTNTTGTKIRGDWVSLVQDLCGTIESWARERKWFVHREEKTITEEHLGSYAVPVLLIQAGQGRIHVEPIGRNIIGAEGRIDISSFPSLNRMLLIRVNGRWVLRTDSGVDWPDHWSKKAFVNLVRALTAD